MFLEIFAYDFFARFSWVLNFLAAKDDVSPVVLDSLVVEGKSSNENCHLEEEIHHNAEASHQAEVL